MLALPREVVEEASLGPQALAGSRSAPSEVVASFAEQHTATVRELHSSEEQGMRIAAPGGRGTVEPIARLAHLPDLVGRNVGGTLLPNEP